MSNRIAGSRVSDRIALDGWPSRMPRWGGLVAARGWLQQASMRRKTSALSPRLRRDVGLTDPVVVRNAMVDVEARRCRL
jgi:hypothetical protein